MSAQTGISWADSTWNCWMGCTKVSPACDSCYAERYTKRFGRVTWGAGQPRVRTNDENWRHPIKWNERAGMFNGCLHCGYRGYGKPKREFWTCERCERNECKPARRRVFCASLADWLDNEVPIEWLVDMLDLIRQTPNLDWLLLSKRIGNWRPRLAKAAGLCGFAEPRRADLFRWIDAWIGPNAQPPPNVWIGDTVVNQDEADRDVPKLLRVPAAVRFLSIEPMLGAVNVAPWLVPAMHVNTRDENGISQPLTPDVERALAAVGRAAIKQAGGGLIDWIICGGESGPHARPMHPEWVRSLRDQCQAAGLPFHFKQWGEWLPAGQDGDPSRTDWLVNASDVPWKVGTKAAGCLLDGRTWNEFPQSHAFTNPASPTHRS